MTVILDLSKTAALVALFLCSEQAAQGAERPIARSSVPAVVITALTGKYPKWSTLAFVEERDQGRTIYEATLGRGAERLEVDVSPQGAILAEEAVIDLVRAPAAVREAFARSSFGKGRILCVERAISFPEKRVEFEIDVKLGSHTIELAYDAGGRLLSQGNADGG
jgi:hypothetical protein